MGRRYTPLFDFFAGRTGAHQILAADFVTTEDGTGLVHMAPAFGEEDKAVTDAAGIEAVIPVDSAGQFTAEVAPVRRDAGLRRQPGDHPAICATARPTSAACCCVRRPTSTPTRTAGAATIR